MRCRIRLPLPLLLCLALLLAACGISPGKPMEEAVPLTGLRFLLLGEVHDNADGHARRLALLQSLISAGARPAIAMEQFDREHQPELTQAMQICADADCVIRRAAPGRQSWHWPYYSPVIELALQYRLPLLAGNGHVRRNLGAPRWLGDATPDTLGIGFLEPTTPAAPYDRAETVATRTDRGDPCGTLKR